MSERREYTPTPENLEQPSVEMVDVSRISTVFDDQRVLTSIADKLLQQGLISGYEIGPAVSGYTYGGKQVKRQKQFRLEILCDTPQHIEEIKKAIASEIGKKWDAPKIAEDQVKVNRELLGFIKNVEREHQRFLNQRRLTRAVALTTLLSLAGIVGALTKQHVESEKRTAVAAERAKSYEKILDIEKTIQNKILEIEEMERKDVPLTSIPPVEFGVETFQETREILQITREAEFEMKKLLESQNH